MEYLLTRISGSFDGGVLADGVEQILGTSMFVVVVVVRPLTVHRPLLNMVDVKSSSESFFHSPITIGNGNSLLYSSHSSDRLFKKAMYKT